jgi:ketosteroid isomerase-like protein
MSWFRSSIPPVLAAMTAQAHGAREITCMEPTPQEIAADYVARWERAWNSQGASATATLYTPDSVLIGGGVAVGKDEIEQALGFIFSQGWHRISIKLVSAHAAGGLVLLVSEFSALGSGSAAGKILNGKSSHALMRLGGTWLSAMHTAVNGAPTPVGT